MIFDDSTRDVLLSWIHQLPPHATYVWGSDSFKDNAVAVLRALFRKVLPKSLNA
jgi:hypothetical protein